MRPQNLVFIILLLAASMLGSCRRQAEPAGQKSEGICATPVSTESGLVKGISESETETCAWHGIPYAAPPVGDLRWKAPRPVKKWDGVRDASKWGHRCMQMGGFFGNRFNADPSGGMSEDCLYLNIWRPENLDSRRLPRPLPVMFFIHGGGNFMGTANTPLYWGDRLAKAGEVVVVTINYRLNYFGFLALPGLREEDPNQSTGNYGILDQIAALKWVQDNIANFGGDPAKVTIFGESAGGLSVCAMLATPLAQGLFAHAILESGGCAASATVEEGYEFSSVIAEKLGCKADDLKCLRSLPAEKFFQHRLVRGFHLFMPHEDGYLLTDKPLAIIRSGNFNKVPFLAGSNRDEFSLGGRMAGRRLQRMKPEQWPARLSQVLRISEADARELLDSYPLPEYDNRIANAVGQMMSDAGLICPTYQGILAASQFEPDTYYYRFDYDNFRLGKYLGAAHAMELPFVFNAFDRFLKIYGKRHLEKAKPLSAIIQGYWTNFAKTGDPNGPGLPEWPRFEPGDQKVQALNTLVRTNNADVAGRCRFWDEHKIKMAGK